MGGILGREENYSKENTLYIRKSTFSEKDRISYKETLNAFQLLLKQRISQ